MNSRIIRTTIVYFILSCLVFWAGCGEEKTPSTHPKGWLNPGSDNFHGLKIANSGIESCGECHADTNANYLGGTSEVACNTCHEGGRSGHPSLLEWINPNSDNYHGKIFWDNDWDFSACQECHGSDLNAGGSVTGCQTTLCHAQTAGIFSCDNCHSFLPEENDVFFYDVKNNFIPDSISIGTHLVHLQASHELSTPLDCSDCHPLPDSVYATGHLDGTTNIEFSDFATNNGQLTSQWNIATATCNNIYCHLGSNPVWTAADGSFSNCDGCHTAFLTTDAHYSHTSGLNYDCSVCHDGYSMTSGSIVIDSHIDGNNDISLTDIYGGTYSNSTCTNVYCHGTATPDWMIVDGTYSACGTCHELPPSSGAHLTHVTDEEIDCGTCHMDYSATSETTSGTDHINLAVDVKLEAAIGGSYDSQTSTCTNVYCHSNSTVGWNDTGLACGSCHDLPPATGAHTTHVDQEEYECGVCHDGYSISDELTSEADHIDQEVDVTIAVEYNGSYDSGSGNCSEIYCHSDVTVAWDGPAIACGDCHAVPPAGDAHPTHVNDLSLDCSYCHDGYTATSTNSNTHVNLVNNVDIYATAGGSYSEGSGTCSSVRCHGSQDIGWSDTPTLTCTSCHGGIDNDSGAPPFDLDGNTAVTDDGVGAHTIHLTDNDFRTALECSECHTVPATVAASGHFDPDLEAEINFGSLATNNGSITPVWNSSAGTCAAVYCHGNFEFLKSESSSQYAYADSLIAGNNPTFAWSTGTDVTCGDCHSRPPTGHTDWSASIACGTGSCHPAVAVGDSLISSTGKTKHINGMINLTD